MKSLADLRARAQRSLAEESRACRASGGRPVGVLCGLIPPELIHAAGGQPMRLRTTDPADPGHCTQPGDACCAPGGDYFAATHCSLVRRLFNLAQRERLGDFDAVLFATGCDHSRRMYDAWRHADLRSAPPYLVPVPSDTTPTAVAALVRELEGASLFLRESLGTSFGDAELRHAIALYNRQRELLGAVYQARARRDCPLSGADMLSLSLVLATVSVEEGNEVLEALLGELPHQRRPSPPGELRLFLAAGHFEELRRMEVMERFGGRVVHDLMCTGGGYFLGQVDADLPPLTALARRTLYRLSCPHAADAVEQRAHHIAAAVQEWGCDGVILDRLSFCSIWAAEAFVLRRRLRAQGIAVLELEGELGGSGEGQIQTRLEAFAEQIRNRSTP